jgi:hypothetical protein
MFVDCRVCCEPNVLRIAGDQRQRAYRTDVEAEDLSRKSNVGELQGAFVRPCRRLCLQACQRRTHLGGTGAVQYNQSFPDRQ